MNKKDLFFLLLIIGLFQGCTFKLKSNNPELTKLKIIYSLPSYTETGEPVIIVNSSYLYSYNIAVLYQIHMRRLYGTRQLMEDGPSLDSLVYDSIVPYYFLFKQRDTKGFGFNSPAEIGLKNKNVDSFLKYRPQIAFYLDTFLKHSYKSALVKKGKRFSKEYYFENNNIEKIKLIFDNTFPNVPYSISSHLDSVNKAKLTKAVFYINRKFVPASLDDKFLKVEMELIYETIQAKDSLQISLLKSYALTSD